MSGIGVTGFGAQAGGSRGAYRLADEPSPSTLSRLAVKPFWPLLAMMVGGAWIGLPWFALNGHALGSPTRRKELALVAASLLGAAALIAVILVLDERDVVSDTGARLALLLVAGWKLACAYGLQLMQGRTLALYEYFGGKVQNGMLVVLAAAALRASVLDAIPVLWLKLVLA